jgi:hypothetical protein
MPPLRKDSDMKPRLDVEFRIFSTRIGTDQITELIGLAPTDTWTLGEQVGKTSLRRKDNAWRYSIAMADEHDHWQLDKTVKDLLQILMPKASDIRRVCHDLDLGVEVSCGVYIADQPPTMNFTPDIISDLAAFNATLDIDVILISSTW